MSMLEEIPRGYLARHHLVEREEREARRTAVLRRLDWRLSWSLAEMATSLAWPGGTVGVRIVLDELVRAGLAEESGSRWGLVGWSAQTEAGDGPISQEGAEPSNEDGGPEFPGADVVTVARVEPPVSPSANTEGAHVSLTMPEGAVALPSTLVPPSPSRVRVAPRAREGASPTSEGGVVTFKSVPESWTQRVLADVAEHPGSNVAEVGGRIGRSAGIAKILSNWYAAGRLMRTGVEKEYRYTLSTPPPASGSLLSAPAGGVDPRSAYAIERKMRTALLTVGDEDRETPIEEQVINLARRHQELLAERGFHLDAWGELARHVGGEAGANPHALIESVKALRAHVGGADFVRVALELREARAELERSRTEAGHLRSDLARAEDTARRLAADRPAAIDDALGLGGADDGERAAAIRALREKCNKAQADHQRANDESNDLARRNAILANQLEEAKRELTDIDEALGLTGERARFHGQRAAAIRSLRERPARADADLRPILDQLGCDPKLAPLTGLHQLHAELEDGLSFVTDAGMWTDGHGYDEVFRDMAETIVELRARVLALRRRAA